MAGLELRRYATERVADVLEVYNRGVAGLPYCCTLDAQYFLDFIVPRFFFVDDGLIIAYRQGRPVGYVHSTFAPSADRQDVQRETGTIAALFFPPDEPEVGAALVAAAERWLAGEGARRVIGWGSGASGYPFYRGLLSGLEPVLVEDHRAALAVFRAAGYVPYVQSYLSVADFQVPFLEPSSAVPVSATIRPRSFETRWDVDAWRGHQPMECRTLLDRADADGTNADGADAGWLLFAVMPRLSQQSGTGIGGIAGLAVPAPLRRRGIAALMMARSLNWLYEAGVRRCLVVHHRNNAAAAATYAKFGFRPAALMVGLERALT